ncbi:glycoside hydrolase family 3 protein [Nocardioides sp. CF8]|uniref:glycoside hydrolase family 3 N-terminal domain-containing protein n=1 Tax=Nocardioides sp. CF8 TaxID=110319 RepID=UPI00032F6E4D|nr:glycoside hydrolase family 3 N-terminal domain-containing protein [Nocardioides sp. CF8]EON25227.1 glycoside hydrolase family 3 protein [Nocardioides sp. CF8]
MRRFLPLIVALSLLGSACSGDPEAGEPTPSGSSAPTAEATQPPTPAERLGLVEGWGPTTAELERAARIVGRMRLPDLAGQVIVAEWQGTAPPVAMVRDLHLGGVIAFADNVSSTQQIRDVNATLERAVRRTWPLFLSVDQEGGIVERIKSDATRFPTFMSVGAAGEVRLTKNAARASGAELRGLGFDVVFAPDADVTSGPGDPTIGSRSVGSDVTTVIEHVGAAVDGYTAAALVPVLKHFPGHGSVPQDSHLTLPVQTRTRKQLGAVDLAPFAAAVEQGVPAIMAGHIDVRALDPKVPASMSKVLVTDVLRGELGFDGLVVTDSLSMAGVRATYDAARSAVQGLRAGNDVLLMPPSPAAARAGIVAAVKAGRLKRARLEQAAARQIALLLHYEGDRRDQRGRPPGAGRAASRALSAAALTVVAGSCRGRLVGSSVTPVGDPVAVANFSSAARAAGLTVLVRQAPPASLTDIEPAPARKKKESRKAFARRKQAWQARERQRASALSRFVAAEDTRLASGTNIGFSGYQDAAHDGEIAVATNTPYVLGQLQAPVRIAAYGDTPGAMSALVDVLLGKARAKGSLPVPVPGVERKGC